MPVPGIGSATPQTLLEIIYDTSDEWIRMHTGIHRGGGCLFTMARGGLSKLPPLKMREGVNADTETSETLRTLRIEAAHAALPCHLRHSYAQ